MKRIASLALLALALAGCAPPPRLDTPSGRPQAFYAGESVSTMQNAILDMLSGIGMTITKQTSNLLVAEKRMGFTGSVLLGYNAERQLTFTFVRETKGTEVFASEAYIEHPGDANQSIDPDNASRQELQDILLRMQAAAAEKTGPFASR